MENQNSNVAPTEQELYNAGFEDSHFGLMEFNLGDNNIIVADTEKDIFRFIGSSTWIELTKQKINDAFALFNQPIPQWEKTKPKVGEVWGNDLYTFVIIKDEERNVLKIKGYDLMGDWSDFETATYKEDQWKYFSKLADTLEDYYKEKFLKIK